MKTLKLLLGMALMIFMVSCASSPRKGESAAVQDSRKEYVDYAEKRIKSLEKGMKNLDGDLRQRYEASLRDARAELNGLKQASSSTWTSYRDRVNNALEHLEELREQPTAE